MFVASICQVCYQECAIINARLDTHRGLLFSWHHSCLKAPMCRTCFIVQFRRAFLTTSIRGWWSLTSLLLGPISLLLNVLQFLKLVCFIDLATTNNDEIELLPYRRSALPQVELQLPGWREPCLAGTKIAFGELRGSIFTDPRRPGPLRMTNTSEVRWQVEDRDGRCQDISPFDTITLRAGQKLMAGKTTALII